MPLADERLSLALQVDVARIFDSTISQTQLENNQLQAAADDLDLLASYIEDAEDILRQTVDLDTRLSRRGTPGERTTFETVTYELPGHENYKAKWMGVGGDYLQQQVVTQLDENRIAPWDPDEGDAAYMYVGLAGSNSGATGDSWEEVTDDEGGLWTIIDNREGRVAFHPIEIDRAMLQGTTQGVGVGRSRLRNLRFQICYRHGQMDRSRSRVADTELSVSLNATDTDPVAVEDVADIPEGPASTVVVLKIGREYLTASLDRDAGEITPLERGVRGTSGQSHDAGDRVLYVPPTVRNAVASQAAMSLLKGSRYVKYLPDNEDDLNKGELMDDLQARWDSAIETLRATKDD